MMNFKEKRLAQGTGYLLGIGIADKLSQYFALTYQRLLYAANEIPPTNLLSIRESWVQAGEVFNSNTDPTTLNYAGFYNLLRYRFGSPEGAHSFSPEYLIAHLEYNLSMLAVIGLNYLLTDYALRQLSQYLLNKTALSTPDFKAHQRIRHLLPHGIDAANRSAADEAIIVLTNSLVAALFTLAEMPFLFGNHY